VGVDANEAPLGEAKFVGGAELDVVCNSGLISWRICVRWPLSVSVVRNVLVNRIRENAATFATLSLARYFCQGIHEGCLRTRGNK